MTNATFERCLTIPAVSWVDSLEPWSAALDPKLPFVEGS